MNNIYLDTASTTKPNQEVVDVIVEYLNNKWHNPSSLYSNATKVKENLNSAKKTVADFISANADEIYFTSSGSESNCWALQGFVNYTRNHTDKVPVIITSKIEHHSIMACLDELKYDAHVFYIDVNKDGVVNIKQLDDYLHKFDLDSYSVLVSIMHANNEIGSIQDIELISKIVHGHNGAILHCDCTQSFGHIPIDVNYLGIDMMTASGHKISAPKGTAILYKRNGININPLIFGSQMNGLRGGTENTAYIMGFAKAVELSKKRVQDSNRIELVRDYFINKLTDAGCKLNGPVDNRLPSNINVMLPKEVGGEEMLLLLDMSGICIGVGSACNSMMKKPSYVLKAIGLTDEECARSIRITFSEDISNEDIDKVVKEIENSIKILRQAN
jgi:cysteine desulfurase